MAVDKLSDDGLPVFFKVSDASNRGFSPAMNRHGQSVRTWARSLSVMQKEALVLSSATGTAWRLASDEGPYLEGFDAAPCPLAFFTTGMVASTMNELMRLAAARRLQLGDVELVQDNFYTMAGSALRGTMTGGALPVELTVNVNSDVDETQLRKLVADAVAASPVHGLLRGRHESLFSLSVDGTTVDTGEVATADGLQGVRHGQAFTNLAGVEHAANDLVTRITEVRKARDVPGGVGSSLQSTQNRTLQCRGTCRVLPDGRKEVIQELISPLGSTFRFLSDESPVHGGHGRAPDAASYAAAGIAFCFLTQLGRYAKIVRKDLAAYSVVQDVHFSSVTPDRPLGIADAVETQVDLSTAEDDDFARATLRMGEQTCFLHALCRTDLDVAITIVRR